MNYLDIYQQVKEKRSFLCVGLDTDIKKIPTFLLNFEDPIFEFNRQIIDATHDFCIAYKLDVTFYGCRKTAGWISLQKTIDYIKTKYPKIFVVIDARCSDIENTSEMYAEAFFEELNVDAVTVAPYMGKDSVEPFLKISQKGVPTEKMMYVVEATRAEQLLDIRKIIPEHFILIPEVEAQRKSLRDVAIYGMTNRCGLIFNFSRQILYASDEDDFAKEARNISFELQEEMEKLLMICGCRL